MDGVLWVLHDASYAECEMKFAHAYRALRNDKSFFENFRDICDKRQWMPSTANATSFVKIVSRPKCKNGNTKNHG